MTDLEGFDFGIDKNNYTFGDTELEKKEVPNTLFKTKQEVECWRSS